eukprot:6461459-Amphidinium_carterae.2
MTALDHSKMLVGNRGAAILNNGENLTIVVFLHGQCWDVNCAEAGNHEVHRTPSSEKGAEDSCGGCAYTRHKRV